MPCVSNEWELPPELCCRPMPFVALMGLDMIYNAVHRAIWEAFSANRRTDRVPVSFKILPGDHEFPKCRTKRTSYEWYIPKGILKVGWMHKHLNVIPAVAVVFFELDWDEPQWRERQSECSTRVEIVRQSLQGRGTKVAVVLIQKKAPLPPGEDLVASERASTLCAACELSAKALFVLPHTDHIVGYIIRLENAFYELSQGYYHAEARKVKSHKELLNRTTHQTSTDVSGCLTVSQGVSDQCSNLQCRATPMWSDCVTLMPLKQVVQRCKMVLQQNAAQQRCKATRLVVHKCDKVQQMVGQQSAAQVQQCASKGDGSKVLRNSAAQMYSVFGDLFDEAIKLGLTAIQTQHPGFYYQQAAYRAQDRKKMALQLCKPLASVVYPLPDPLETPSGKLDYFGQRPWRQGHQSIDPPDPAREREGILALQLHERAVDHSGLIIPTLSSAVAQFKKYKCPRMKNYLMVQMGEEYYCAKDYTRSLTLFNYVLCEYRVERWWMILTSILSTALKCAFLMAQVQDYITISMELLGRTSTLDDERKSVIQKNLMKVLMNTCPDPEPACDEAAIEVAKRLWKEAASLKTNNMITVEMQNYVPFVECKAAFLQESFSVDSPVKLQLSLRAGCPFPQRYSHLSVTFNNQAYNVYCMVSGSCDLPCTTEPPTEGELCLLGGKVQRHDFSFVAETSDTGKAIEIESVRLELGSESGRRLVLHWLGAGGDAASAREAQQVSRSSRRLQHLPSEEPHWDSISIRASTLVQARTPRLTLHVEHDPPALSFELFRLCVCTQSREEQPVSDVQLTISLQPGQDANLSQTTHVTLDCNEQCDDSFPAFLHNIPLGNLQPGERMEKDIFVKTTLVGSRIFVISVAYTVTAMVGEGGHHLSCRCQQDETVVIETLQPFDMSVKHFSMKVESMTRIYSDDPFLLQTNILSLSPCPITIARGCFRLQPPMASPDGDPASHLKQVQLQKDEIGSDCCCLQCPPVPDGQSGVAMGTYTIFWKRSSAAPNDPLVTTVLTLPHVIVETIPLYVHAEMPAFGRVREVLPLRFQLHNRTAFVQEVEATVTASDAFMFSGNKLVRLRILAGCEQELLYNLYPLMPGFQALPQLLLRLLHFPGATNEALQRLLPTHIFVKPQARGTNSLTLAAG
uniref:trafficking protein particle complex subunit 11 n=1 Tax=Myxine glutinosa TaxID=7769 RepID=UPI00358EE0D2